MRALLVLALLLTPADDVDTQKDALTKALTNLDRAGVDRACSALVKINDERCPEVFLGAFRAGLLQYQAMDKERLRLVAELAKNEVVVDKDGKVTKGDGNKWKQVKYDYDIHAGKMDVLTGALPRVAGQMSRLTSTKAITAVMN